MTQRDVLLCVSWTSWCHHGAVLTASLRGTLRKCMIWMPCVCRSCRFHWLCWVGNTSWTVLSLCKCCLGLTSVPVCRWSETCSDNCPEQYPAACARSFWEGCRRCSSTEESQGKFCLTCSLWKWGMNKWLERLCWVMTLAGLIVSAHLCTVTDKNKTLLCLGAVLQNNKVMVTDERLWAPVCTDGVVSGEWRQHDSWSINIAVQQADQYLHYEDASLVKRS